MNKMDIIRIASFDIGKVNFAFCVEIISLQELSAPRNIENLCLNGKIEEISNVRLVPKNPNGTGYKTSEMYTFEALFKFLESLKRLWNNCHIFVIEQQVKANREALKICHHLEAYLKTCYGPFKEIVIFPSSLKTAAFLSKEWVPRSGGRFSRKGDGFTYSQRKKWSIEKATEILEIRGDETTLQKIKKSKKKDDLCDVICQLQAYKWLRLVQKTLQKNEI